MLNNRLLSDRYKILEMIGGGGMANVYLAYDMILEREVAIKVLRLDNGNDEEFIARFHREAQAATSLSHPNIVNIYDVGEEDDIYYMVMEYVDGMTLKKYIQQHSPISVSKAIDITQQITTAISHAHDNDIVHRDIKPQNILIDHFGHVKVTDFGIAMALSATALTQTNAVLGSVHYLSPEQARGGMATKKSDVYSLGIVLFELLTGRLPFSGESPVSIALKHLQHDTPSLRRWITDLPQSVENIVLRATAKDPFHRYNSVIEMENDLETSLDSDRLNEPAFTVPIDDNEEKTKAIPVITEEFYGNQPQEDTIIHSQSNKVDNDKGHVPPKQKKGKKIWLWISSLLLILILAGSAALFIIPGLLQPDDVEMIDVEGMEYEDAYSALHDLNLGVKRKTMYSDSVKDGYVIKTEPEAGMIIKEESEITVYSSRGKETIEFEDYIGRDFEQVEQELHDKGFETIESNKEESNEYQSGEIMDQIYPRVGDNVVPEDTQVVFVVSQGPPKVTVPSLVGESEKEAEDQLKSNKLEGNITREYSNQVPKGQVISQNPEASTEVEQGSTVNLTVSLGEKEEPAPRSETITIDVLYNGANQESEQSDAEGQEEPEKSGQKVLIYIGDMDNEITDVYIEETIKEDRSFEIQLTIAPGTEASYKVQRGDKVIEKASVSY